ncbi:DUF2487 family protein [Paenibacillus sp. 2TAB19]|uniref:DUF2487 family protein n=1 Tax=Paenibacillus sp. 2TAB19 TaxID=3233003 RepID=UPI003F9A5DF9
MKFSEIEKEQWEELRPYLDTCLLPVTGMDGSEQPYEATEWLERLRDIMDLIEIPFKGRVVTYPACHYVTSSGSFSESVNAMCAGLKRSGFKYVVLVSANPALELSCEQADLWIRPNEDGNIPEQALVSNEIRLLWQSQTE